jgi:hypothetical protein
MAGDESDEGNTLLADFILFAKRLEQLGFTYDDKVFSYGARRGPLK